MQGSEYQSHAHPGHVPAPGQQPVYELETTAAAPRACHHNGFPNRDESGTLLKSPSIRSRQTPIPKNTLMNWRWPHISSSSTYSLRMVFHAKRLKPHENETALIVRGRFADRAHKNTSRHALRGRRQ